MDASIRCEYDKHVAGCRFMACVFGYTRKYRAVKVVDEPVCMGTVQRVPCVHTKSGLVFSLVDGYLLSWTNDAYSALTSLKGGGWLSGDPLKPHERCPYFECQGATCGCRYALGEG